jgi:hypothetical protein
MEVLMKRLLIFSMVLGLMAGAVETSAAHGVETGRSGTIVTGAWWDAYLDGATGCDTAPECRAGSGRDASRLSPDAVSPSATRR